MSRVNAHYDGYEIKHLSFSENFACFVPPNDSKTVFILEISRLRLCDEEKSLSKTEPKNLCYEHYEVKIVRHFEFGNMIYVLTYDDVAIRVHRAKISTTGDVQTSCISEIPQESVSAVDFDVQQMRVALASPFNVYICNLANRYEILDLGTHMRKVTSVNFLTTDFLGSLDESGLCKVWNTGTLILHGSVLLNGMSSFVCAKDLMFYGTNDGQIYSTSITNSKSCPEYFSIIPRPPIIFGNHDFKGSFRQEWNITTAMKSISISDQAASEVLAIGLCPSHQSNLHMLCIVTTTGIYLLNQRTRTFDMAFPINNLLLPNWCYATSAEIFVSKNFILIGLRSFNGRCVLISVDMEILSDLDHEQSKLSSVESIKSCELSFLATAALSGSNTLGKALVCRNLAPKMQQASASQDKSIVWHLNSRSGSRNAPSNQPVTFGHAVKSSGYAPQGSKVTMFRPQIAIHKAKKNAESAKTELTNKLHRRYRYDPEPSFCCLVSERLEAEETPIYSVSYSPTDGRVAVAQGNGLCSILRTARSGERTRRGGWREQTVLVGHQGIVSSAEWSLDGHLIITTSTDRTARLWSANGGALRLVVASPRGGCADGHGQPLRTISATTNTKNCPISSAFVDHVQFGKFHLQDSFFHVTCQNKIFFFTFNIDKNSNVLQKCHKMASYRQVARFVFDSCTRLTAVSSTNLFYSYLLLAVGSDRCLYILDINSKKIVREIQGIHKATVTGVAINQGSLYSSFTAENPSNRAYECGFGGSGDTAGAYSFFATAAPGDSVRLWDLRVARGHVAEVACCRAPFGTGDGSGVGGAVRDSAVPPVSLTFSPCGRYVCFGALASTSTTQYLAPTVVDIRQVCRPLAHLTLPDRRPSTSSAATVVAWNPIRPEITTGSLDGRLSIFG
ncbi:WD repeat containing protein 27 [Echinococcus multilocularis]|uniref:WD repeat containing protein 27 n=1 Tax=Echinococcus multilocularis TaxID=6211 RepID=A0A068Y6N1_ECHMU|nr:WD repeat containing protein 27 [Echinococcus multilocularis]